MSRPPRDVVIIGLGLMGGSLARDCAAAGMRVHAWDTDAATLAKATTARIVTALDASLSGIPEGALIVLAVPVDAAGELVTRHAARLRTASLITDVGSTKRSLAAAVERAGLSERFVGAHPLAGDHRPGWDAARRGLFDGARVFLCPASAASDSVVHDAERFWATVGGRPEIISAEAHDERLAWTSHLPQLVATSLALALADAGVTRRELGPGGRDMTRLGGSSAVMWTSIVHDNTDHIAHVLGAAESRLAALRSAVERGRVSDVRAAFEHAARWASD